MSRNCPRCSDPLSQWGVCGSCGFGRKASAAPAGSTAEGERNDALVSEARRRCQDDALTSADLTDQQWYNVCKFFPFVAAHCKRSRPEIGPAHPLDRTAHQGPIFKRKRMFDSEAATEREAIQADA